MWFVIIALTFVVSAIASLVFGRALGKASAEQTFNPNVRHGPSLEAELQAKRLEISESAVRKHKVEVHLN